MSIPTHYLIIGNKNSVDVSLYPVQYKIASITLDEFKWYPALGPDSPPFIVIRLVGISGKVDEDGVAQDIIDIIFRNENGVYEYQRTFPDACNADDYANQITFRFEDGDGNLINTGFNDQATVPYKLKFSVIYGPQ